MTTSPVEGFVTDSPPPPSRLGRVALVLVTSGLVMAVAGSFAEFWGHDYVGTTGAVLTIGGAVSWFIALITRRTRADRTFGAVAVLIALVIVIALMVLLYVIGEALKGLSS